MSKQIDVSTDVDVVEIQKILEKLDNEIDNLNYQREYNDHMNYSEVLKVAQDAQEVVTANKGMVEEMNIDDTMEIISKTREEIDGGIFCHKEEVDNDADDHISTFTYSEDEVIEACDHLVSITTEIIEQKEAGNKK